MKSEKCLAAGMGSYSNKTPPDKAREENEVICRDRRRVVVVPLIVEPVVVPVPLLAVPIEITDIEVAIGVAVLYKTSSVPLPIECPV